MAAMTNEELIEELLRIDAKLESYSASIEELAVYSRETVRQVAVAQKESKRLELILACRNLDRTDAAQ